MDDYVGQKLIAAHRASKDGLPGYDVTYGGYLSWSPEEAFEEAYQDVRQGMNFGGAIFMLKRGKKVARKGWNGKDMWIALMDGMSLPPFNSQEPGKKVNDRTAAFIGEDTPLVTLPYIATWTADGKWLPGWLASQTDMLADDWVVVD